jgi:hypothetical protein
MLHCDTAVYLCNSQIRSEQNPAFNDPSYRRYCAIIIGRCNAINRETEASYIVVTGQVVGVQGATVLTRHGEVIIHHEGLIPKVLYCIKNNLFDGLLSAG